MPLRASVVIPTFRGRSTLPEVLRGLARQTESSFEAVVVSDGTKPSWLSRFRPPFPFRVLEQAHAGAGVARNLGARSARSPLLIFLADDVVPDRFFVASHLGCHAKGKTRVAVGITAWHPALPLTPLMKRIAPAGDLTPYPLIRDPGNLEYDFLYGSNLSLPRSLALRFPFDPSFSGYGWEDTELGYRLRRSGVRMVLAPKAVGWHRHAYTAASWQGRKVQARKAFVRFLGLHPEEGARLLSNHRKGLANRERLVAALRREAGEARKEAAARRTEAVVLKEGLRLVERTLRLEQTERRRQERALRRERSSLKRETRKLSRLLPFQLEALHWSGAHALEGWHPWEGSDTPDPFRWSAPSASLRLPPGVRNRWEMGIGVSAEVKVRRLEIRIPGRPVRRIRLRPGKTRILLGPLGPSTRIRLRASPPGMAPGDPRPLGIQLFFLRSPA